MFHVVAVEYIICHGMYVYVMYVALVGELS